MSVEYTLTLKGVINIDTVKASLILLSPIIIQIGSTIISKYYPH